MAICLSVFFFLIGFQSCKKIEDSDAGIEIQPEGDKLNLNVLDTFSLKTTVDFVDSTNISNFSRVLLGSYIDPFFGEVNNSFYTQIRLNGDNLDFSGESSNGDANALIVDSVILTFSYIDELYGNNEGQNIEVYELAEQMFIDSVYYPKSVIMNNGVDLMLVGQNPIVPNINDSTNINGVKEQPQLKLYLNPDFGQNIISLSVSNSITKENFTEFVKGFYIKTNNSFVSGQGGIFALEPENIFSRMLMYYRDPNGENITREYEFIISDQAAWFTNYGHNYFGTDVYNVIQTEDLAMSTFYVQAGFGIQTKVELPEFDSLQNVIINRAKLIVPISENSDDNYPVPTSLLATYKDSDSVEFFLPGHTSSAQRAVNSIYNEEEKQYELIITDYIQSILTESIDKFDILLNADAAGVTVNRAVLNGQQSTSVKKIKLELTLTKY